MDWYEEHRRLEKETAFKPTQQKISEYYDAFKEREHKEAKENTEKSHIKHFARSRYGWNITDDFTEAIFESGDVLTLFGYLFNSRGVVSQFANLRTFNNFTLKEKGNAIQIYLPKRLSEVKVVSGIDLAGLAGKLFYLTSSENNKFIPVLLSNKCTEVNQKTDELERKALDFTPERIIRAPFNEKLALIISCHYMGTNTALMLAVGYRCKITRDIKTLIGVARSDNTSYLVKEFVSHDLSRNYCSTLDEHSKTLEDLLKTY